MNASLDVPGSSLAARSIAELIALPAQRAPRALAVLAPERDPLTFDDLAAQIDRATAQLAAMGFGRGQRIALALPDGPEMAVALITLLGAATCVPLNPALDEAAYRVTLSALAVDALIVPAKRESASVRAARALGVAIVHLMHSRADRAGTFTLECDSPGEAVPLVAPASDDVALILQTSGTTAAPKAVPLTHRHLVAPALARAQQLQLSSVDRCLCVVPLYNSGMRRCLFPVLAVGGSVVCAPGFVASELIEWIERLEPTFYIGVPALQRAVADEIARRGPPRKSQLRYVLSGGAALPVNVEAAIEAGLGVPVVQTYAMSETGAIAQTPLPPARRIATSVGLPAGNDVAILGEGHELLPPEQVGEIVVRGPEVFAGYENDPEANRRAFIDGWFRTGDLGRIDHDGYVYIVGRVKELINRGGQKVSPSVVDAALARHPDVADVATFAVAHTTLGEDVVTAAVLRPTARVSAQALRDHALASLPGFMVPTQVMLLDAIPRSAAGKVQRDELARLLGSRLRSEFAPPRNPHETIVARVFTEVLGVDRVGAFDNFFELGGDSLRGAQVVARVNAALACRIDVASLFQRPTVAELATEIRRICAAR